MTKNLDEDTERVFLVVIENALQLSDYDGHDYCIYCSWHQPQQTIAEVQELQKLPTQEQQDAWRAAKKATYLHDEDCIVPNLRTRLGLPNPRAVYPD